MAYIELKQASTKTNNLFSSL